MPSEKTRSKEDTWRPEELEKSLKEIRGERRKHRDRDDLNGEDKERRRREKSDSHEDRREKRSRNKEGDKKSGHHESGDTHPSRDGNYEAKQERKQKDEEREERHRRKREERKARDDGQRVTREEDEHRRRRKIRDEDETDSRLAPRDRDDDHRRAKQQENGDENNHNYKEKERQGKGRDRDRSHRRDDGEDEKRRHRDRDSDKNSRRERHRDDSERRGKESSERGKSDKDGERRKPNREDDDRRRSHRADDDRRRSHKDDDERRRSHKDDDRRRSHKDDDERRRSHKDDDRRRSHKDDDERRRSHKDDDDRRRSHKDGDDRRRSHKDGDERRRSHKDDDDRRRSHKDDRRKSDRDGEKQRRHRDDSSRERRGQQESDDEEPWTKHQEKRDREKDDTEYQKHRRQSEDRVSFNNDDNTGDQAAVVASAGDDYEDDFEDYEEDFEDEEDGSDSQTGKDFPLPEPKGLSALSKPAASLGRNWDVGAAPQNEVDEVLRALDAENDRLMAESRRSYGSDSTELSDERFKSQQTSQKQRTFINFVSAQQRTLSDKTSNKTRVRGRDLLQMIDLDVATYDMFDLPPVKEYDLYIRNFGRTDTRQVYVQTNDDNIDRDIQTDELEYLDKWCQHPADDSAACGRGDGETEEEEIVSIHKVVSADLGKLSRFINRAGQTISILLEEEAAGEEGQTTSQSNIAASQGFTQLGTPAFLKGRYVRQMCFSPSQSNLLLTLYSPCQQKSGETPLVDDLGILCVWNVSQPSGPQKILVCDSCPISSCFSPSNSALVFAGMVDGSLVVWDVREQPSLHHTVQSGDTDYCLRYPTYNTAGVLGADNHQSAVVTITATVPAVNSSKSQTSVLEESGPGASFQIISVDETATINLWVVAEIASPDLAGSESDLGLSPGGRVKLLKSSSFVLDNPAKDLRLRTGLRVTCLQLNPADPNQFVVGTDAGFIVHGVRFGSKPLPRSYLGLTDAPVDVTCIDFSPFGKPCFLAGCEDGTVRLYHSHTEKALISWPARADRVGVVSVQWSRSRPAVFYILYDNSTLAIYDLVETDAVPASLDQISTGRAIQLSLSPDAQSRGKGEPHKHPHMVLTLDSGKTEIHSIAKVFVEPQPFEDDFLTSYLDRF